MTYNKASSIIGWFSFAFLLVGITFRYWDYIGPMWYAYLATFFLLFFLIETAMQVYRRSRRYLKKHPPEISEPTYTLKQRNQDVTKAVIKSFNSVLTVSKKYNATAPQILQILEGLIEEAEEDLNEINNNRPPKNMVG